MEEMRGSLVQDPIPALIARQLTLKFLEFSDECSAVCTRMFLKLLSSKPKILNRMYSHFSEPFFSFWLNQIASYENPLTINIESGDKGRPKRTRVFGKAF
jgi:hypothetical protein